MDKTQRIHLKAIISILGILLLLILFGTAALIGLLKKEPEHIPVVRKLTNVWVMEVEENCIIVYENGEEHTYLTADGYTPMKECREQVADITLTDDRVSQIYCKIHKVNGKVLSVDETGVTVEGIGYLPFAEDWKGYQLYGTLAMSSHSDIMIGYDFADFVVEDQTICGVLLVKEEAMEYIRVLIMAGDYQAQLHDTLEVTCDTDYMIEYGPYEARVQEMHSAGEITSITADSDRFQSERIRIVPSVLTGKVILNSVSRSQGVPAYRGTMEVLRTEQGLAVINEVALEEYLYSVVPSEMPSSYPTEALKAQAICARTYAYRHMLHAGIARYGAHVDDSTGYQVYNNINEQEATTSAVKETYGQMLLEDDGVTPAQTFFYSTSCGIGTDPSIWQLEEADELTYLTPQPISHQEVEDREEDGAFQALALMEENNFAEFIYAKDEDHYEVSEGWYRWDYTVAELDAELIRDRLIQRYEANPKRVLTLVGEDRYESRPVKEWNSVKELYIAKRGLGGVAGELVIVTEKDTYKVLTEYNIRYVLCDTASQVELQNGSQVKAGSLLPSGYIVLNVVKEKENVTGYRIHGGGYGHGVGMSQNGAKHMASDAMTASDILTFFYQGCIVRNIYGS